MTERIPPQETDRIAIAYVVHTFDVGGLEHCIARLVNHLDRNAYEPSIVCLNRNGSAAQWLETDDTPIRELHKRSGNDPFVIIKLARLLRAQRFDIVHSHNWGTLVETSLARKWAGVKCHVHAVRGMNFGQRDSARFRNYLRNRTSRWALKRCDCLVAVAESVRDDMTTSYGMLDRAIRVIPNGVDGRSGQVPQEQVARLRKQIEMPAAEIVFGTVGRLVHVKNLTSAIEAIARLVQSGVDAHFVIVGDGPDRSILERHAAAANVSRRIHFAGHQTNVDEWLTLFDVYVNSSLSEGMSQSILEAMASGIPMIVTDVGESSVLAGGDQACGLIVPADNTDALYGAMAELAASSHRRRELGENGLVRHNERYGVLSMINAYESLYRELTGNTVSTPAVASNT